MANVSVNVKSNTPVSPQRRLPTSLCGGDHTLSLQKHNQRSYINTDTSNVVRSVLHQAHENVRWAKGLNTHAEFEQWHTRVRK